MSLNWLRSFALVLTTLALAPLALGQAGGAECDPRTSCGNVSSHAAPAGTGICKAFMKFMIPEGWYDSLGSVVALNSLTEPDKFSRAKSFINGGASFQNYAAAGNIAGSYLTFINIPTKDVTQEAFTRIEYQYPVSGPTLIVAMVYEKPIASNPYFDATAERVYGFSTIVSGCAPINVRLGLLNSVGTQKSIASAKPTDATKKSTAVTPVTSTPQLQQINQIVVQQPVRPAAATPSQPVTAQPVTQQDNVPVAAPASAPAKSTASYEDTMAWLKGKIDNEGGYAVTSSLTFTDTGEVQTGTNTFKYAVTSTESCLLRWNNPTTRTGNTMNFVVAPSSVNLSELAPNIKVQPTHDLMGPPFSSGKGFTSTITPRDPSYVIVALTKNDHFIFADADIAQRVANALNHAIEVCGGKVKQEIF